MIAYVILWLLDILGDLSKKDACKDTIGGNQPIPVSLRRAQAISFFFPKSVVFHYTMLNKHS